MMIKKILKNSFVFGAVYCSSFISIVQGETDTPKSVSLNLLNKTSAKKHPINIPLGGAYVIQDIRIVPQSCKVTEDEFSKEKIAIAEVEVYLEQDVGEETPPILLYRSEISTNHRRPSSPLEHPIYDIMMVGCD